MPTLLIITTTIGLSRQRGCSDIRNEEIFSNCNIDVYGSVCLR